MTDLRQMRSWVFRGPLRMTGSIGGMRSAAWLPILQATSTLGICSTIESARWLPMAAYLRLPVTAMRHRLMFTAMMDARPRRRDFGYRWELPQTLQDGSTSP